MIETLLDFSGLEDISRDLQLLSGAENNRVLREATRAGANVLKEEVVSRAPVRRGKLRRNVVVLSRRMWSPCWMAGRRWRFRGWFSA